MWRNFVELAFLAKKQFWLHALADATHSLKWVFLIIIIKIIRQYLRAVTWPKPKANVLYKCLYNVIQYELCVKNTKVENETQSCIFS